MSPGGKVLPQETEYDHRRQWHATQQPEVKACIPTNSGDTGTRVSGTPILNKNYKE